MPWANGGTTRTSTPHWRNIRRQTIIRDGNQCANCGADGRIVQLECDHIIPVTEGGPDNLDNAQLLCKPCHQPKTQAEAARGRRRRTQHAHHPAEQHPGHQ